MKPEERRGARKGGPKSRDAVGSSKGEIPASTAEATRPSSISPATAGSETKQTESSMACGSVQSVEHNDQMQDIDDWQGNPGTIPEEPASDVENITGVQLPIPGPTNLRHAHYHTPTLPQNANPRRSSCPPHVSSDHNYYQVSDSSYDLPPPAQSRPRISNREQIQGYGRAGGYPDPRYPRSSDRPDDDALQAVVGKAMQGAMREVSTTLKETLSEVSRTMMETVTKSMSDLTTAASQAQVVKTINGYAATHPPPKKPGKSSKPRHSPGRKQPGRSRRCMDSSSDTESSDSQDSTDTASRKSRNHQRNSSRRHDQRSSSTSSADSPVRSENTGFSSRNSSIRQNYHSNRHVRLPPFTGQEPWTVYYNRFKDVAELEGWTEAEMLRELLPRLQGKAGEFVYGQLTRDARSSFKSLARELKNRFRKVETSRTFGAKFSNRNQQVNESVEEYAAELKRLYDKAHANRDKYTRKEDLLRRFLDGIQDDTAKFQVEYVKEPVDIDQAVFEVVSYLEARKRAHRPDQNDKPARKMARAVKGAIGDPDDREDEGEDGDSDEDVRAVYNHTKPRYGDKTNRQFQKGQGRSVPSKEAVPPPGTGNTSGVSQAEIEQMKLTIQRLEQALQNNCQNLSNAQPTVNQPPYQPRSPVVCYRCGQPGHYARDCTANPSSGHVPVTTHAGTTPQGTVQQGDSATPVTPNNTVSPTPTNC